MKKTVFQTCLLFSLLFCTVNAATAASFSGKAGAKLEGTSNPEYDNIEPILKVQGFYSAQFDFSNQMTLRSEFSVQTADIIETGLAEDTEAVFRIDEISVTKHFLLGSFANYFSLFFGTYEPIGSDIFLRRLFGIEEIDSAITQSWLGLKGSTVLPFFGAGGSYIVKADAVPLAGGIYIYANHRNTNKYELNLDTRFAGVFNNFCFDIAGGFGAPLKSSDDTNADESFLIVDELFLHGGTEFFIGNKYSGGLFGEIGIQDLRVTRSNGANFDYSSDNLYLLIEPRFVDEYYKLNLSFFSFPKKTVENLFFVDNALGIDANIFNDLFHSKELNYTFGSHFTLSWDRTSIKHLDTLIRNDTDSSEFEYPDAKVSPYIIVDGVSSKFQAMVQIITSELSNDWQHSVRVDLSYQKYL